VAAAQRIATRDARVFARIYNLTDRLYIADRLEGIIVGTPRRIAAGVEWRF
jgi:outer membrane receptor protein involved in Fe transport